MLAHLNVDNLMNSDAHTSAVAIQYIVRSTTCRSARERLLRSHCADLSLMSIMSASETMLNALSSSSNCWRFKGEGNANIVLTYTGNDPAMVGVDYHQHKGHCAPCCCTSCRRFCWVQHSLNTSGLPALSLLRTTVTSTTILRIVTVCFTVILLLCASERACICRQVGKVLRLRKFKDPAYQHHSTALNTDHSSSNCSQQNHTHSHSQQPSAGSAGLHVVGVAVAPEAIAALEAEVWEPVLPNWKQQGRYSPTSRSSQTSSLQYVFSQSRNFLDSVQLSLCGFANGIWLRFALIPTNKGTIHYIYLCCPRHTMIWKRVPFLQSTQTSAAKVDLRTHSAIRSWFTVLFLHLICYCYPCLHVYCSCRCHAARAGVCTNSPAAVPWTLLPPSSSRSNSSRSARLHPTASAAAAGYRIISCSRSSRYQGAWTTVAGCVSAVTRYDL